jgi:Asp-tRNA(Asn)/Glu-tRNA(Gln) amidotransferase A subunit family amidase
VNLKITFMEIQRYINYNKNPWNINRTSGGSSGGESAILALKASPLGLGGDIGGSVRIPCLFTGLYSLKPTNKRITLKGIFFYEGMVYPNIKYGGFLNI